MKQQINEIKRMQQLAGLQLNEVAKVPLAYYPLHIVSGIVFQTLPGLNILEEILDEWDDKFGNKIMDLTDPDDKEAANWLKSHPLYNKYVSESTKAYKILQNAVSNTSLEDLLDLYNGDGDNRIIDGGPSIIWEEVEDWDNYDTEKIIEFLEAEGLTLDYNPSDIIGSWVGD